jgi:hypothetical protein
MSKSPPIPPEQRSFPSEEARDRLRSAEPGRRDETTGLQSEQPGDDDVNLKQQGRQGNIYENTHNQGYQQDR